jgi:hypothetical protein
MCLNIMREILEATSRDMDAIPVKPMREGA